MDFENMPLASVLQGPFCAFSLQNEALGQCSSPLLYDKPFPFVFLLIFHQFADLIQ